MQRSKWAFIRSSRRRGRYRQLSVRIVDLNPFEPTWTERKLPLGFLVRSAPKLRRGVDLVIAYRPKRRFFADARRCRCSCSTRERCQPRVLCSLSNTVTDPYNHQPRRPWEASLIVQPASQSRPSMAGHAGVSVNSQLTLRVDYLMKTNQHCGKDRYWDSSS